MFKLEDGREQLYQWDVDRRLIVNDPTIREVHFCNRTSDCSLVVDTYTDDNIVYADIPNILLQEARPIRVYAYCEDKYTLTEQVFTVKARTRPSDYIYRETEVRRVEYILRKAEDVLEQAEAIGASLDNFYTKEETDTAIAAAVNELAIPDTDEFITETELEAKGYLTEHQSLDAYATTEYVSQAIAGIVHPEPDLSGYYTKTEIDNLFEGIAIAEEGSY